MKVEINVSDVIIDNIDNIKKAILSNHSFKIIAYGCTDEFNNDVPSIGLHVEAIRDELYPEGCTFMMTIPKSEAGFLAKSILAIDEFDDYDN